MKWKLINTYKEGSYDINNFPFLIGRNPKADIICRHEWISKNHAHITSMSDHLFITDTSSNGVYVNNERIVKHKLYEIKNGDCIRCGIAKVKLYDFKLTVEGSSIANKSCDNLSLEIQLSGNQNELCREHNIEKIIEPIIPMKDNTFNGPESPDLININDVPIKVEQKEPLNTLKIVKDSIKEEQKIITNPINYNVINQHLEEPKSIDVTNINDVLIKAEQHPTAVEVAEDCIREEQKRGTNYSQVEIIPDEVDIIAIDEDDDLIPHIKQEVKIEVDAEFLQIKKEIAEMDYNEYEMAPIEITDSEDSENDELLTAIRNYVPDVVYVGVETSPEIQFEESSPTYNERTGTPTAIRKDLNQLTHQITAKSRRKLPEIIPAQPLPTSRKRKLSNLDIISNQGKARKSTKLISDSKLKRKKDDTKPNAKRGKMKTSEALISVELNASSSNKLKKIPKIPFNPSIVAVSPALQQSVEPVASTSRHLDNNAIRSPLFNQEQQENALLSSDRNYQTQVLSRMQHNDSWLATMYIKEFRTFFLRLFSWEISYFQAPLDITSLWEKIDGSPMTKMPMTYSDYRYYQRAMSSIVMGELFAQVYKELSTMTQDEALPAYVVTVNTFETYNEIVCYYYVGEKELSQRPFDCSLVKLSLFSGSEIQFFGIVGPNYTSKVKPGEQLPSLLEKHCHSYPLHKHTFSIFTRRNRHVAEKNCIYVDRFFSMRSNLLKLSAIKAVHGSISKQILSPVPNQFLIPDFPMSPAHKYLPMNQKQEEIVSLAMRFCQPSVKSKFFLIQGPPGTGKSNVIVNIVLNALKSLMKGEALLVFAQSNAAINHLLRRIVTLRKSLVASDKTQVKIVRIGQISQTAPDLIDFHLDKLAERNLKETLFNQSPHLRHDYRKLKDQIKELSIKTNKSPAEEKLYRTKAQKYTNFVRDCLLRQYNKMWLQTRDNVLLNANLICSTVGSIHTFPYNRIKLQFKCCIMDEATQATEPDTLIPLAQGVRKFILVGDIKQLPSLNLHVPKEYMYNRSLYVRLQSILQESPNHNSIHKLDTQYRMREEICYFPNRMFYGNSIKTHVPSPRADLMQLSPYLVFERYERNCREIDAIVAILKVINKVQLSSQLQIGIILPYNDQNNELQRKLQESHFQEHIRITINTIDQFQGQEQDIILLSLVLRLANDFVDNRQRLNVALTRAKSCMYVLGSPALFQSGALLTELQNDAQQRGLYVRLQDADFYRF